MAICHAKKSRCHPKSLWERACSRRRPHSQHHHCLTHRFREQARSHIGYLSHHKSPLIPESLWERACSRKRQHSRHPRYLTQRFREQARSHIGYLSRHKSRTIPESLWERACSRKRQHIQHQCCLTQRFREQARSHIGYLSHHRSRAIHKFPVGASLLAKASAHPASMLPDPPLSRASSLPHWLFVTPQIPIQPQIPCRSEPARDSVRPADIPVA